MVRMVVMVLSSFTLGPGAESILEYHPPKAMVTSAEQHNKGLH
jgi:hypothetical protein